MSYYNKDSSLLRFSAPHVKIAAASGLSALLATCCLLLRARPSDMGAGIGEVLLAPLYHTFTMLGVVLFILSVLLLIVAVVLYKMLPDTNHICIMVKRGLFHPSHGNPLHLQNGELLPHVSCKRAGEGLYDLIISAQQAVTVEAIVNAAPSVSAALNRRFQRYAVISTDADTAFTCVTFRLDDVQVDRSLTFQDVESMAPESPTKLKIDSSTYIDLTTSGHILIAGKTRSGKTTGIVSLLLQVLLVGPDNYGSHVLIIDPKRAELSMCPHTVTVDEDGEARCILAAMQVFANTIADRQKILNDLSVQTGDAVHWWEAGFHPSFLFIDELVALRSILPKKAEKDCEEYSLTAFEGLLKRIVTMGASAGCYAIISIAEASVQEGGLPAMLRSAMSTRVLFRPTMAEGKLIWEADKLSDFASGRVYGPGDAWFSSTDGLHDTVSCVHFPRLEFPAYREFGRLLQAYYDVVPRCH